MRSAFATVALLALLSVSSPAPAQYLTTSRPLTPRRSPCRAVSRSIYRLRLDEGVWKIEGRDVTGRFVRMRIDPRTGDVVRLDRGWW